MNNTSPAPYGMPAEVTWVGYKPRMHTAPRDALGTGAIVVLLDPPHARRLAFSPTYATGCPMIIPRARCLNIPSLSSLVPRR